MKSIQWIAEGGAFVERYHVDLLRASIYKHANIAMSKREYKFVRVLLAKPDSTELSGIEGVREYYKKNGVKVKAISD